MEPKRTPPLKKPWLGDLPEADRTLVAAAAKGDGAALAQVRKYTDHPARFRQWGNPAYMAGCWLLHQVSGDDEVVRQAACKQIAEVQRELGYQEVSYLERLAISRVVHNWLMVTALEAKACSFVVDSRQLAMAERALSQAERRYMQALRNLAFVRRVSVDELAARVTTVVTTVDAKQGSG